MWKKLFKAFEKYKILRVQHFKWISIVICYQIKKKLFVKYIGDFLALLAESVKT